MKHLDLHISLIAFLNVSEIYLTRVKCLFYSPTQGKIQLHALKKKKKKVRLGGCIESYLIPIWINLKVSIKWDKGVTLPNKGKIYLYLSKRKCQFPKLWLTQLIRKGYFDFNNECYSWWPDSPDQLLKTSKAVVLNNFSLKFLCDCKTLKVRFTLPYLFTIN